GCVDEYGVHHDIGDTWPHPSDPCLSFLCTRNGIVKKFVRDDCPPRGPRPHSGCKEVTENCCEKWDCFGCIDPNGVHHDLGHTWPAGPCTLWTCTRHGIVKKPRREDCPPLGPRPNRTCEMAERDCCDVWDCVGCVDANGIQRKIGEEWYDPLNPCIH
ncbi:hypothetical protein Hamer_G015872, partial [Homarus americanus]